MNTVILPHWVLWLQALGPIAIAVVGAFIALGQLNLATAKRKDDLFDRRYKLLLSFRLFFQDTSGEAEGLPDDMTIYDVASDEEISAHKTYLQFQKEDLLARTAMLFDERTSKKVKLILEDNREAAEEKYSKILRIFRELMA